MPTYRVTDPKTGKTLRVTGDSPPSAAELEQIFAGPMPAAASLPEESVEMAQSGDPSGVDRVANAAYDVAVGAGKGALNTVTGLGKIARKVPVVSALDRIMTPIQVNITPKNTAQRIGFGAEQLGEFFVPMAGGTTLPAKARLAADVAKSGVLTMAQGGTPTAGVASAALTAAMPGVSSLVEKGLRKASGAMQSGAEKSVTQALGATKEWAKADAAKLAPEMLARGVGGSRPAMLSRARAAVAATGQQLDDAYKAAAAAGDTVSGQVVRGHLQLAADALKVKTAAGVRAVVPGTERAVQQLERLDDFVAQLGDDIPVDKAAHVKRTWDRIVSKAGLFGPKATSSSTDNADAWAIREASGTFRELLNTNPTIAALNKEYGFWAGMKKVLFETQRRTQAQRGGLTDAIRGSGGAVAGAMAGAAMGGPVGGGVGAVMGQQAMQAVSKAIASPWFKTRAAAPFKARLADALASGNTERIIRVAAQAIEAVPARVTSPIPTYATR